MKNVNVWISVRSWRYLWLHEIPDNKWIRQKKMNNITTETFENICEQHKQISQEVTNKLAPTIQTQNTCLFFDQLSIFCKMMHARRWKTCSHVDSLQDKGLELGVLPVCGADYIHMWPEGQSTIFSLFLKRDGPNTALIITAIHNTGCTYELLLDYLAARIFSACSSTLLAILLDHTSIILRQSGVTETLYFYKYIYKCNICI